MSRKTRGVALIELVVVVGFIALFSVAIAPNYVAMKRGQEDRAFLSRLKNILATGKVRAVEQRRVVTLVISEDGDFSLTLPATGEDENDSTIASLAIPESFSISRLFAGNEEVAQEDWSLSYFADGTCDGGAIELERGNQAHIYSVEPESCAVKVGNDDAVLGTERRWPAGTYETRQ